MQAHSSEAEVRKAADAASEGLRAARTPQDTVLRLLENTSDAYSDA
jgi:hypothetical protein